MAAVLIKTLRFNHSPHITLRPWYQHPKLWFKFSHIAPAERVSLLAAESIPEQDAYTNEESRVIHPYAADSLSTVEIEVTQWNVLQFNTGSTTPFIIKCGANSSSELVIKAEAKVQDPKGSEIIRVLPRPPILADMSFEEIKNVFDQLPEAVSLLALARTAEGTRARYSRLYRTLAIKVPSLKDLVTELEKGGTLKDIRT